MQVLRASVLLAFIMLWQPPLKIKHSPTMPEENREESKWETGSLTGGTSTRIGVWLSSWEFLRRKNKPWSIKGIMLGILYDYLSEILSSCMLGNAMEMITAAAYCVFFSCLSDIKLIVAFWMRSQLIYGIICWERSLLGPIYPGFQDISSSLLNLIRSALQSSHYIRPSRSVICLIWMIGGESP